MQIHWDNIVAMMLVICSVALIVKYHSQVGGFLATMKMIGPGHDAGEQTLGLIAFGIVVISIVVVCKIVTQNKK